MQVRQQSKSELRHLVPAWVTPSSGSSAAASRIHPAPNSALSIIGATSLGLPFRRSAALLQQCHALRMMRHGEQVEDSELAQGVAELGEGREVAGESGGVAGDVGDGPW